MAIIQCEPGSASVRLGPPPTSVRDEKLCALAEQRFFTGHMSSLPPRHQCQSTEGNYRQLGYTGWLGSRVVSVLDSGSVRPGFKLQSRCCRVSLGQTVHTPRACSPSSKIGSSPP